jgi:hypothetical protein
VFSGLKGFAVVVGGLQWFQKVDNGLKGFVVVSEGLKKQTFDLKRFEMVSNDHNLTSRCIKSSQRFLRFFSILHRVFNVL